MNKIDTKQALVALDMVHADLFSKIETLKESGKKTMSISEMDLRALFILVSNAMADMGDKRIKVKK